MGFRMYCPTRLEFGIGKLNELHTLQLPGKKALIVTSNGKSAKASGALDRTEAELKQAGVSFGLYSGIGANPTVDAINDGAKVANDLEADFIVALGGGSVIDGSKGIAAVATNCGSIWDYIRGGKKLTKEPLPVVAITTTAGTGSEVDPWCVTSNTETQEKMGFTGRHPVIAIVDAELMKTVPPKFTAYQGFDAMFHSIECYISNKHNQMSDMYCLTAISNCGKYLIRAVKNGGDMEARDGMAFANTLSGVAMTLAGNTSQHGIEHALSAFNHNLPHGAGLIMISKAYFSHYVEVHACDQRFIDRAKALGVENASKAKDFIDKLVDLQKECGVSDLKLSDYGFKKDDAKAVCEKARSTSGNFKNDPVALSDADIEEIYTKSYR